MVHTNHLVIKHLIAKEDGKTKTREVILLQEFDWKSRDKNGKNYKEPIATPTVRREDQ